MTDETRGDISSGDTHPIPEVRDAHDAKDHAALERDPLDEDATTDIANDESFPASDSPSHMALGQGDPALSSGYDERAERALAAGKVGSPVGQDNDHLTETAATGGKKLGVMRYVLGISLAAIIVIFAGLLLIYR